MGKCRTKIYWANESTIIKKVEAIIKLDPDAYCLRTGAVKAILKHIGESSVIGSVLDMYYYDPLLNGIKCTLKLSLGGVVAMRKDFIKKLAIEPFLKTEDYTRTLLLKKLGQEVKEIPEVKVFYKTENYNPQNACFVHPYVGKRWYHLNNGAGSS